jgi:hypothetical protein
MFMNAKLEITRLYIEERTSKLGVSPSLLAKTQRWLERLKRWLGESPSKQGESKS